MSVTPAGTAGDQGQHETRPVTVTTIAGLKRAGRPIVMVTAYDTPSARIADEAGVDIILVGDSLGMTVLGLSSTLPVTLEQMLHHTAAVVRGARRALVVADMPFLTYQVTAEDALRNAGRFVAEAGASAVKVEGGASIAATVRRLVDAGIPVMGHVGLTPQSVNALGGYRVQAKDAEDALRLVSDCEALQEAGAFAIVLECIPADLADIASRRLAIPTIGIGAGARCDGQVQVLHDVLGMGEFTPRHAKRYAEIGAGIRTALEQYAAEVRSLEFPSAAQSTPMEEAALRRLNDFIEATSARGGDPHS